MSCAIAYPLVFPQNPLKEISTKQFSAAMLKKSLRVNNASDLPVRQPIKMLEIHYLLHEIIQIKNIILQ